MNVLTLRPQAVAALLALAAIATQVNAQTAAPATSAGSTADTALNARNSGQSSERVARADRAFMAKAAASGMFEVEASRLAASKAADASLRTYASMLVDHHTAANQELKSLAASKRVVLPAALPRPKARILDRLSRESGTAFDGLFMEQVGIKAHQEDIRLFQLASRGAKDADVRAFATKTLPTLQRHLAEAQANTVAIQNGLVAANTGTARAAVKPNAN